ncbi:MAG TPA: ClpX C4-type zinc finger protein [Ktedonobacteraceae bacterium]|jgi:ATP-dependent protease Clp ATPase subunit|nr:ClpX C4-type zinc finger protein [Ktedonobacteraceae bacterium]
MSKANRQRKRSSYYCSFCQKEQSQVQRLIAGPGYIYVCDECIMAFLEGNIGKHMEIEAATGEGVRCSFCGKKRQQLQRLIGGPNGVNICDRCLQLCREIIEDEQM